METIKVMSRTDKDGMLRLQVPLNQQNMEYEILLVLQPVMPEPVDGLGYPLDFFEETFGSFANEPLARGEQGSYEVRDELS
jgi:hypothetical protein